VGFQPKIASTMACCGNYPPKPSRIPFCSITGLPG
jgi:hypothetical protein